MDFTNDTFVVTIPATLGGSGTYALPGNFRVIDDNVNEVEQSFALVAWLGDDVPDEFACFQRQVGDIDCFERVGATEIKIVDNDRKFLKSY